MAIKRVKIKIEGQVQGIGFRFNTFLLSKKLALTGFAQNMPDGSVIIEAQGDSQKVGDLIEWAKKGSESAKVSKVNVEELEILENEREFKI